MQDHWSRGGTISNVLALPQSIIIQKKYYRFADLQINLMEDFFSFIHLNSRIIKISFSVLMIEVCFLCFFLWKDLMGAFYRVPFLTSLWSFQIRQDDRSDSRWPARAYVAF